MTECIDYLIIGYTASGVKLAEPVPFSGTCIQAVLRNKWTPRRSVKSKEEADAKGCERDVGGRLSRSSVEVIVMIGYFGVTMPPFSVEMVPL